MWHSPPACRLFSVALVVVYVLGGGFELVATDSVPECSRRFRVRKSERVACVGRNHPYSPPRPLSLIFFPSCFNLKTNEQHVKGGRGMDSNQGGGDQFGNQQGAHQGKGRGRGKGKGGRGGGGGGGGGGAMYRGNNNQVGGVLISRLVKVRVEVRVLCV